MKTINHSRPTLSIMGMLNFALAYCGKHFSDGTFTKKCISKLCVIYKKKYGVLFNSGTSSIHILLAQFLKSKKNEVILSGYSCSDIVDAIRLAGGKAIFIDSSFRQHIDVDDIKKR